MFSCYRLIKNPITGIRTPVRLQWIGKKRHRKAFHGKCLVIVQNVGKTGTVRVEATSGDLEGQCEFSVINQ